MLVYRKISRDHLSLSLITIFTMVTRFNSQKLVRTDYSYKQLGRPAENSIHGEP